MHAHPAVWMVAQAAAATVATVVYAAFGDRIARSVNVYLSRGDVYRTGFDAGFEDGYAAGRRVARPVIVPSGPLRAYPRPAAEDAAVMRVETC